MAVWLIILLGYEGKNMSIQEQQMQQLMEAGEHEYNALMDEYNPPHDWNNPEWEVEDRTHNWRNYASDGLKEQWSSFTGRQQIILSANFSDIADREEWD